MRIHYPKLTTLSAYIFAAFMIATPSVLNAQSQVEKALSYKPMQKGTVSYDIPSRIELKNCKISKTMEKYKRPGFEVTDANGKILRVFFDNNRDNSLDSWSYFKDGIEVYRDADTDFDGRADEFRWLGSAGTRRGVDTDKNGKIDRWLTLSASELAEEVFHAVRTADDARFKKLLVSQKEISALKLGKMSATTVRKVKEAANGFQKFARSQKAIKSTSKWTQFGSTRPNLIAKGTQGIEKDLLIYDHAAAVFENGSDFGQISLGTIVEVSPNNWRVLELPQVVGEGQVVANGGLFYPSIGESGGSEAIADSGNSGESREMIKLFEQYDKVEKQLEKASRASDIAKLEEQRGELLLKLAIASSKKEEQQNWIRQLADTVTSSFQSNRFPTGLKFLESKLARVRSAGLSSQIPYIEWRMIYSRFSVGHATGDRRARVKANDDYIEDLEQFAKDYPKSNFAADALFQLGLNSEVTERDDLDNAIAWYRKCQKQFPNTVFGKKAAGALRRLTSQGKKLPIAGSTIRGQRLSLSQYSGKIVIVHYWETWCDSCIEGFEELQRLSAKYRDKIRVVGVNLDEESSKLKKFLSKNRNVNWPQLHSPGGVDRSPLAIQMGIATLPMNILVDDRGNMVESNVPIDELDREIQRLLRRQTGQANRSRSTR